jgi:hypothetical protein
MNSKKPEWDDEETTIVSFSEPLAIPASTAAEPSVGREPGAPIIEDSVPALEPGGGMSRSDAGVDPNATVIENSSQQPSGIAPDAPAAEPEATIYESPKASRPGRSEEHTHVEGAEAPPSDVEDSDIAWLVLTKTRSVRRGATFNLNKPRIEIGSGITDISVNDPKVSRLHAVIRYERSGGGCKFVLYDMASTNGTLVNDRRLTAPAALNDGDRIGVGDTELVFKRV